MKNRRFDEKEKDERVAVETDDSTSDKNTAITVFSSVLSLVTTIGFAVYNAYLGLRYGYIWNISITVYYALLSFERAFLLFSRVKSQKENSESAERKRKKEYVAQTAFLFAIDLVLIVPITLMVFHQRAVNYSTVSVISFAVYATYKIIMAIINEKKAKKSPLYCEKAQRSANLIDALVSVLSLQYAMVMTVGNGVTGDMYVICIISSFVMFVLTITIAALSLKNAVKTLRVRNEK